MKKMASEEKKLFLTEVVLFLLFRLTAPLLSMLFIIYGRKNTKDSIGGYHSILNNWQLDLTGDITTANIHGNCIEFTNSIFNSTWPGTDNGCDCLRVSYCYRKGVRRGVVSKGSCSYNETRCGCNNVPSTPSINLVNWPGETKFCSRIIKDSNFKAAYKNMNSDGTCKKGYNLCGNPDSVSKGICISGNEKNCPITDIAIGTVNPSTIKYGEVIKGNSSNVYLSRSNYNNPVVEILNSQEKVCVNADVIAWTVGRWEYPLLSIPADNSCKVDERYKNLTPDSWDAGEADLFVENNLKTLSLPGFYSTNVYRYKKFIRNVVEFSPSENCRAEFDKFFTIEEKVNNLKSRFGTCFGLSIAMLVVGVLFGIFEVVFGASKKTLMVKLIFMGLRGIYQIIFLGFVISLYNNSSSLSSVFYNLWKVGCSDSFTNELFKESYLNINNYGVKKGMAILLMLGLGLLIEISVSFCIFTDKCKFNSNRSDDYMRSSLISNQNKKDQIPNNNYPAPPGGNNYVAFATPFNNNK